MHLDDARNIRFQTFLMQTDNMTSILRNYYDRIICNIRIETYVSLSVHVPLPNDAKGFGTKVQTCLKDVTDSQLVT